MPSPSISSSSPAPGAGALGLLDVARVSDTTGWVLTNRGILWTENGGASWRSVDVPGVRSFGRDGFFVRGSSAWIATLQPDTGLVSVTRVADGAKAVTRSTLPARYPGERGLALSFVGQAEGWLSVGPVPTGTGPFHSDLFRTSDGGTSWSRVAEGAPFDGPIHFRTTTEGWALGAQLHRTEDGGRTWKLQHPPAPFLEGLPGRFIALSMFGPRGVLQVAIPTGMQAFPVFDVTSDGGRTWTAREGDDMTYAGTGHPLLLAASDADHWHVARGAEVWTTADAARHWTKQKDLPGMTFALSFPTHAVGWAAMRTDLCPTPETCEQRWSLMSTLDGGERWEPIKVPDS